MMYSGIVHVNYIEDGFCFLESYVYCMVALHHLHQTGGRLDPYKCPDVVEGCPQACQDKAAHKCTKRREFIIFFLILRL